MKKIDSKIIIDYISERTIAKDTDSWKDVKIKFGYDPTFLIGDKLYRPANLPPNKSTGI